MPLTLCTARPPRFQKATPLNGWLSVSWYNVVWTDIAHEITESLLWVRIQKHPLNIFLLHPTEVKIGFV